MNSMTTCAIPSCESERVDGTAFCSSHGPRPAQRPAKRFPTGLALGSVVVVGVFTWILVGTGSLLAALIISFFVGAFVLGIGLGIHTARADAAGKFVRPELVCPHCQTKGQVSVRLTQRKVGISGGKAAGAVLTGGLSVVATGLSRKQMVSACRCRRCGMTWVVA